MKLALPAAAPARLPPTVIVASSAPSTWPLSAVALAEALVPRAVAPRVEIPKPVTVPLPPTVMPVPLIPVTLAKSLLAVAALPFTVVALACWVSWAVAASVPPAPTRIVPVSTAMVSPPAASAEALPVVVPAVALTAEPA